MCIYIYIYINRSTYVPTRISDDGVVRAMARTYVEAGPPYLVMDEASGMPIVNENQMLFGLVNHADLVSLDDSTDETGETVEEMVGMEPTCVPSATCLSNTSPPDIAGRFKIDYKFVVHGGNATAVAEDETDTLPIIEFTSTADRNLLLYTTRLRDTERASSNTSPRPCLWTFQACGLWMLRCTESDDFGMISVVVTNTTDAGRAESFMFTYVETGPANALTEDGGVNMRQYPEVGNAVFHRTE